MEDIFGVKKIPQPVMPVFFQGFNKEVKAYFNRA
jgi:hypothetical protein